MNDYQLERLNTRSFEQLVQALSLEVIGRQVKIFGDGPDGGREASFDGPVAYPEGRAWNGRGIVQAKFRQQPDALAKKNADWALAQLKAEFKKLKPRKRGGRAQRSGGRDSRICPEYYVFATNLTLSAVANSGGKDRVAELLDGYRISHGLQDWALWDGDQIRRMLDANAGIRMSYAAWVLPGDVLTAMMEHLELKGTDFPATMRSYLERELRDDQFAKLGQGGYTEGNAIRLSNVFVDLPVEGQARSTGIAVMEKSADDDVIGDRQVTGDERKTFLDVFFEEGRQVLRPSAQPTQGDGREGAGCSPGRVVLVGGPGQGKTTLGQFACQMLRAALLRATRASYSAEVQQALTSIEQQSSGLPAMSVLRYPLRVDLKRLAEALATTGPLACNSLLDFLVKHINRRTDASLSNVEFRRWLSGYPWLLVLDGLDEVPASSNRIRMIDAIRDFIGSEAQQQDADLLVLATTRPQGYSDEFDPTHYQHLNLLPLKAAEALRYGTRLAEARHPGNRTRIEDLSGLLQQAANNTATVRLMESPLQVTIMLALIEGGGVPPEHRWRLFHDYYDVIYRREKERGTSFSQLLGRLEPDFHWIHHRAGWLLQQRNATPGHTAARLSHSEFEALVDARLLARGHADSAKRRGLVREILIAATDRLVLLVGNTSKEIGFEIRSLQEFMAAEHCFDGREEAVQRTISAIAPHAYWRNVFLFIAGRIFFQEEMLVDTLLAVCHRLNDKQTDPSLGYLAAGSRLALSMLQDGSSRNQPNNTRLLAHIAAQLIDQPDSDSVDELAPLFNGESAEVMKEALHRRTSARDVAEAPWSLCLQVAADGVASLWAREEIQRYFPWRQTGVAELLEALTKGRRASSKLLDQMVATRPLTLSIAGLSAWLEDIDIEALPNATRPLLHDLARILGDAIDCYLPIVGSEGEETPIGIGRRPGSQLEDFARVHLDAAALDGAHPQWRAFHAASEFARRPSLANLGQQIQVVMDLPVRDVAYWHLPWQFVSANEARLAGMPIAEIVHRVKAGALGQSADWARWSQIAQAQIVDLGRPNGLLSASDSSFGAVIGGWGWSRAYNDAQGHLHFARDVANGLPRLEPRSQLTATLVDLCAMSISIGSTVDADKASHLAESIVDACRQMNVPLTRSMLVSILQLPIGVVRQLDLVLAAIPLIDASARIDHHLIMRSRSAFDIQGLSNLAIQTERVDDFVLVLSHLPLRIVAESVPPSLLSSCSRASQAHVFAATLVEMARLDWSIARAQSLAEAVLEQQSARPNLIRELAEYVELSEADGVSIEELFLAILSDTNGRLQPRTRVACVRGLSALISKRPAVVNLVDPMLRKPPAADAEPL